MAAKNDCDFNEFVNIISGLNVENIASINFTPKINMFRTLAIECITDDYEAEFYKPRKKLNGENLNIRIIKLYRELDELIANEIANYCRTVFSYNVTMASYKEKKNRLSLNINEDPEFIKALQQAINQIPLTKLWKKTPVNKRPTLIQNARKKLRKEWEERRKEEEVNLILQKEGIRNLLKRKLDMETELKKKIVIHMRDIGNKRDYTERLAGLLLNHYYEMSYPNPRDVGRSGMLTRIKMTITVWFRTLENIITKLKVWNEARSAAQNEAQKQVEIAQNKEKIEQQRQQALINAARFDAELATEEIEAEMAKILAQKKKERRKKYKELRKQLKQLEYKRDTDAAKKIQRAFRYTRRKSTRTSEQQSEEKQPSLQPIDNVDRSIIERIKELYGYLMEKKIFKTYREKRERILTVLIPYHRHLLQFMKEILIPHLEQKNIRVVVTGGFATALLTGNYKTEDVDMKLYLIRETEENNANFKMRDIVKAILHQNLDFLNDNQDELSYEIYEPSRNPLENNGDIPIKITGRINEEKEGKRENPRVTGDYDAVGEITFSASEFNGNLIDVEGIPVLSSDILIDNLLNHASNNFRERIESGERNIYPEKLLGWMKQLQALLRLKNPDAANELSKEINRMKSPSPKQGGNRKKKRKTRKKRRKKKKTRRKRKKNRKKRTRKK